jgi:hypothetical protein
MEESKQGHLLRDSQLHDTAYFRPYFRPIGINMMSLIFPSEKWDGRIKARTFVKGLTQ